MDSSVNLDEILPAARSRQLRFDRIVVTSVFGNPLSPLTWSGAPYRLSAALRRHGVSVSGFQPQLGRVRRLALAARHIRRGYGKLAVSEQILRSAPARDHHAREIAAFIASHGLRDVLHTGTLDLPAFDLLRGVKHYLYCDHTWSLALPHRPDAHHLSKQARDEYDRLERESYLGLEHIFTFGAYVRDELIRVYEIDRSAPAWARSSLISDRDPTRRRISSSLPSTSLRRRAAPCFSMPFRSRGKSGLI
jgi:hypothetical protein